MEQNNIFSAKNLKIVILITLGVTLISLGVSFLQTPKYRASVKLITIFNQNSIDPYTASKTSDYINSILGEVIYSNSFIQTVMASQFHLKDELGSEPEQRAKNWKDMVKVQIQENKGIIAIDVYHPDRNQADQFAQAIAFTLINNNQAYHGLGDKISLKLIDQPYTTSNWAEPKIGRNAGLGAIAGLIIGLTLIFIFPEQQIFKILNLPNKSRAGKKEAIKLSNESPYQMNLSQYGTLSAPVASAPMATPEIKPIDPVMEAPKASSDQASEELTEDSHRSDSQFYQW